MIKASVIINTFNRADYLPNAILSIASQNYPEVELIVVNGPSTDGTEEVMDRLELQGIKFKRLVCASRNLSESRNIGIAGAAGDVVFFIDDDAVAHREWVTRIMRHYTDPDVGAVGGFTFDHTGVNFQCRYTVCDKFGNARFFDTINPENLLTNTSDFYFPSLLGTNCSFSMRELQRIGGFDEVFAYMLDETDVCLRIFEGGKRVVTVPNAYVFHKYAPSHTRSSERIPTSLLAPARSKVYYCLKHAAKGQETSLNVFAEVDRYRKDIEFANRWYLDHKKIVPAHFVRLSKDLTEGVSEGLKLGLDEAVKTARSQHLRLATEHASVFQSVVASRRANPSIPLKIYLVSQGYPPEDTSGIARWTNECAKSLNALGHEVHVITRSATPANHVDFVTGIWVHSIADLLDDEISYLAPTPLPASITKRAGAVLREIKRSAPIWGVDVVSAPIWDVEGILCSAYLDVPVVTSLHTTYRLALPFKPEWTENQNYRQHHVERVIVAEQWLFENSKNILSNSQEVAKEINRCYGGILEKRAKHVATVPHGLGALVNSMPVDKSELPSANARKKLKLLFVGRIEARKGPDQLLSALLQMGQSLEDVEVVLIGKSPAPDDPFVKHINGLTTKLRAKYPKIDINFLGYIADRELEAHYASADIFVAPSRFESFGLILIEAMRHGVPVVACNIGGMREIITEGLDGFLFEVDNTQQLTAHLKLLAGNASIRMKLGAAGKNTYETKFTAEVMGKALERFFLDTIARHSHE